MSRRSNDYHGSRQYEAEVPGVSGLDPMRRTFAWLLNMGRRLFQRLLGSGASPSPTAVLLLQETKRQLARYQGPAQGWTAASGDRTISGDSGQFPQLSTLRQASRLPPAGDRKPPFGE